MAEQRAQAEQERWMRSMQLKAAEDARRREDMLARLRQANMAKLVHSLTHCIDCFQHQAVNALPEMSSATHQQLQPLRVLTNLSPLALREWWFID